MKAKKIISLFLCFCMAAAVFGCGKAEAQTYKISWYDGSKICTIEVSTGELFILSSIPQKEGYIFAGLYDAEENGTLYADASGVAVKPWTERTDKRLYARWTPKEINIRLDYQGGITGDASLKAAYTAPLPNFPITYKENYEFMGWYSAPNCEGTRYADQTGTPLVDCFHADVFQNSEVTLYAGFEARSFQVFFYIGDKSDMQEIVVSARYGQRIIDVQPMVLFENKAVSSWSTNMNGGGEILSVQSLLIESVKLYAQSYAPVIIFDSLGGNSVSPLVGEAGTVVTLPECVRPDYVFGGWETEDGSLCSFEWTIAESITVRAVWLRTLILRGSSIRKTEHYREGEQINLGTDTRPNSAFAGWYDEEDKAVGSVYIMPDANVTLRAGWYAIKTETQNIAMEEEGTYSGASLDKYSVKIPGSWPRGGQIKICIDIKSKTSYPQVGIYSSATYDSSALIKAMDYPTGHEEYISYSFSITNNYSMIYIKLGYYQRGYFWYYKNLYLKYTFTDTSKVEFVSQESFSPNSKLVAL